MNLALARRLEAAGDGGLGFTVSHGYCHRVAG